MPSRFFKHRLGAIKKPATSKAYLLLGNATTALYADLYAIEEGKDTFSKVTPPPLDGYIKQARFSPDGKFLVIITRFSPYATLYRKTATGYVRAGGDVGVTNLTSEPNAISWSADSKLLAIATGNKMFVMFQLNAAGTTFIHAFTPGGSVGANAMAISPDGNYVAHQNGDGNIYLWKRTATTTWAYVSSANWALSSGSIARIEWLPDGVTLIGTTSNASFKVVRWTRTGDTIARNNAAAGPAGASFLAISPDGVYIAVGGTDLTSSLLKMWKYNSANGTFTELSIPMPPGAVRGVSFSFDGLYFAVGHGNAATAGSKKVTIYRRVGDSFNEVITGVDYGDDSTGLIPYFGPAI